MALEAHECQSWRIPVPTYQYACTACGHRFDAVQSFSDASLTDCPECAGRLRKVFSSVGIVFKGSGFYRTDSRPAAKETGADAKGEAGSDSKAKPKAPDKDKTGAKDGAKPAGEAGSGSSAKSDKAAASS